MPAILAISSRRKSRYRSGSLTRCEIVSKRDLLVLNLQKPSVAKALQMRRLSALHLKHSRFKILKRKLYETNASVKRNTGNTIKQLISFKLTVKMQGKK